MANDWVDASTKDIIDPRERQNAKLWQIAQALPTGATREDLIRAAQAEQASHQEPGLETPLVDPVDLLGMGAATKIVGATPGLATKAGGKLADFLGGKLTTAAVGAKGLTRAGEQALMNEGLWGTRGMMARQVSKALPKAGQDIGSAVDAIQGGHITQPVADALRQEASKYMVEGIPDPAAEGAVNKILKRADFVENLGQGTPGTASANTLQRAKVVAGKGGYTSAGMDRSGAEAAAERLQNREIDKILSNAYAQQHPGTENAYDAANTRFGALSEASRALSTPEDPLIRLLKSGKGVLVDPALSVAGQAARGTGAALSSTPVGLAETAGAARIANSVLEKSKSQPNDWKDVTDWVDVK